MRVSRRGEEYRLGLVLPRQNKTLYDKMKNMTMDQLVLSIMKFGFFSGTNTALGDGKIEIVPERVK
jgi:hypothetical protein